MPADKENYKLLKQYEYHESKVIKNPVSSAGAGTIPQLTTIENYRDVWNNMWGENVLSTAEKNKTIMQYLQGNIWTDRNWPSSQVFGQDLKVITADQFNVLRNFAEDKGNSDESIKQKMNTLVSGLGVQYASQQIQFYQFYYVALTYQKFVDLNVKNKDALTKKQKKDKDHAKKYWDKNKKEIGAKIAKLHKESQDQVAQNKQKITAPKLSKKEIESRQRANLQCALLLNLEEMRKDFLKRYGGSGQERRLNKKDIVRVWLGSGGKNSAPDCNEIIGKLLGKKSHKLEPFLNITPEVVSAMVPMVRLYKVQSVGSSIRESEFVFDQFTGQNPDRKITFDDVDRGDGVGLKEFSFSFHGGNPAMSRKDIKAKLVMYFQTFGDFLATRNNGKQKYRFVDLMLFGRPANEKIGFGKYSLNQYDPSYYRIRADVGWYIRNDSDFKAMLRGRTLAGSDTNSALKNFREALKEINQSFYLNMVEHNIDIKEDGTVMVTAEYQAYIESATKTTVLDALSSKELLKQRRVLNDRVESVLYTECSKIKEGAGATEMRNLIASAELLENKFLEGAYQSIMRRLLDRKLVHRKYIEKRWLNDLEPGKWVPPGPKLLDPKATEADITKELNGANKGKDKKKAADEAAKKPSLVGSEKNNNPFKNFKILAPNSNFIQLNYFFINDLVDVVLDSKKGENGKDRPEFKKTKVVLGSFNFKNTTYNIGEIPVSTAYFFEWMTENVISKGLKSFPLMNFIRSLTNNLINNMLNERCATEKSDASIEFRTTTSLSTKKLSSGSGGRGLNLKSGNHSLRSYIGSNYSSKDVYHYIIIYAMSINDKQQKIGQGDAIQDGNRGVHHLHFGQNRGIVKKISFEKTDIPYSREARYFRHGFDGLAQIGAVYNAKIEMIGNAIFYPGMMVFIDPRGVGGRDFDPTIIRSDANTLGFGGYHLVTKVDSSITVEGYKTTVTALWNYTGEKTKSSKKAKSSGKKQSHYLRPAPKGKCSKLISDIERAIQKWNKGEKDVFK
jgi:hypothetical protein